MSGYSPRPISGSEKLARFIFYPIQLSKRDKNKIKPSIFSHVHNKGCSIQREDVASDQEMIAFVRNFLGSADERIWCGVLFADCETVRKLCVENSSNRSVCVFDGGLKGNPAHAELCQTQYVIEDAERLALRAELWKAFSAGIVVKPAEYRDGRVFGSLPQEQQERRMP